MDLIHYFKKCNECGREILVSIALFGVSHNAGLNVVCKECLRKRGLDKEFRKQKPEDAKEIEKWLKD